MDFHRCESCHFEYDENAGKIACSTCVASQGCGKTRCPRCGFENTKAPAYIRWAKGVAHRLRHGVAGSHTAQAAALRRARAEAATASPDGKLRAEGDVDALDVRGNCMGSVSLSDLRQGEHAVIERFEDIVHVRKFLSMGILPGTQITILRRSPAVVLRVGYSEFAFDRALASTVLVHRTALV